MRRHMGGDEAPVLLQEGPEPKQNTQQGTHMHAKCQLSRELEGRRGVGEAAAIVNVVLLYHWEMLI